MAVIAAEIRGFPPGEVIGRVRRKRPEFVRYKKGRDDIIDPAYATAAARGAGLKWPVSIIVLGGAHDLTDQTRRKRADEAHNDLYPINTKLRASGLSLRLGRFSIDR